MTTQRGRHRKLRRNILHTVIATALLAGTFTVVDQSLNATPANAAAPTVVAGTRSLDATGTKFSLVFNEALGSTTALPSSFTLGGTAVTASATTAAGGTSIASVVASGTSLNFTLTNPIPAATAALTLTVAYTAPTSNSATTNNAIQDVNGIDAANIAAQTITVTGSSVPAYVSSSINAAGSQITLTFNEALNSATAAPSDFGVLIGSLATPGTATVGTAVSAVSVSGSTVLLDLATPVESGKAVTVAYTAPVNDPATTNNAIQDAAGNDTASFTATYAKTVTATSLTVPRLTTLAVAANGTTLTLTYAEALNATTAPASAYTVLNDSTPILVSTAVVSGSTVVLTLSTAIGQAKPVTVSYVAPAVSTATTNSAVQDSAGNDGISFSTTTVTNGSTQDQTSPVISTATLDPNGTSITLAFTDAANLFATAGGIAPASAFNVAANGVAVTVSGATVTTSSKNIVLALGSIVDSNDVVTVSYTAPAAVSGTGNAAIQDLTGNDSDSFTNQAVTNTSSVPALVSINVSNTTGTTVVLTYNESLNATTAPASAFSVVSGGRTTVPTTAVVSGSTITLTLPTGVERTGTVVVNYTAPAVVNTATLNAAIQDTAGFDAVSLPSSTSPISVTNNSTYDTTLPTITSATVGSDGRSINVVFSEPVRAGGSQANTAAWSISVNSGAGITPGTVSSIGLDSSVSSITTQTLTLASANASIRAGQTVTITYTNSSNTASIRDNSDLKLATTSNYVVLNQSIADSTAPVLQSISVPASGNQVILRYNEQISSTLPAVNTTNFGITVNSVAWLPTSISANGTDVILTGPDSIGVGQVVTLTKYTAPANSNLISDAAIQDVYGNNAVTLASTSVTNGSTLDRTAPTFVRSDVNADGTSVTLTFSENLSNVVAATTAFTVTKNAGANLLTTGSTITVTNNTITLTLPSGSTLEKQDIVRIAYTAPALLSPPSVGFATNLAIQDSAGNDLAASIAAVITTANNSAIDTKVPTLTTPAPTVAASGLTLTMTYDESLSQTTAPVSAFTVLSSGVSVTPSSVSITGSTVVLNFATAIERGSTVTVAYTTPGANNATTDLAVQDANGNNALSLTAQAVTNSSTVDTIRPTLSLVARPTLDAAGTTLTLTFSEALAATTAATSNFVVNVNGAPVTVSSVLRPASPGTTITLSLAAAIDGGQAVTVAYTAPANDSTNANSAIQDAAGNDALAITSQSVTNNSTQGRPVFAAIIVGTDGQTVSFCFNKSHSDTYSLQDNRFAFKVNGITSDFWTNNGSNSAIDCPAGTIAGNRWTQTRTTVRIGDVVTVSRTETGTGTNNLRTITDFPVTNTSTLLGRPGVTSIVVDSAGTNIRINYDGTAPNPIPALSDFQWSVNGQVVPLTGSGTTSGTGFFAANIISKIFQGDVVTASYVQPNTNIATVKSFTNLAVTNNSTADGTPPSLTSVTNTADGTTLTLTFNEDLLASSPPLANQFAVTTNGYPTSVSGLTLSGRTVVLTLASPIGENATASVIYTAPAFSRLTSNSAVQDAAGNDSATFTGNLSTNLSTVNQGPMLVSSTVNTSGTAIVLTYDETLSSTSAPTSAFSATANGVAVTITGMTINGSTVSLTVSPALEKSDVVQVSYAAPTLDQTVSNSAVQGTDGYDAASFALTDVTTNSSTVDTKGPLLSTPVPTISATGATLTLSFNEDLGQSTAPTASFTVLVDGLAVVPSSVSIVNNQAVLNFLPVLGSGRIVTIAYTSPGSDSSTSDSALQDLLGNNTASFAAQAVVNNSTVDNTGPVLSLIARPSLAANGTTLTLTYNEALAAAIAAGSAFTVMNGTTPVSVTASSRPTSTTIQLTLATAINAGVDVTVAYTAPASDAATSNAAVQDGLGNDSLSFAAQTVTNNSTQGPPAFASGSVGAAGTSATLVFSKGVALSSAWATNLTLYANGMQVTCSSVAYGTPANSYQFSNCAPTIPAGADVTASWVSPVGSPFPDQTVVSFTGKPIINNSTQPGDVTAPSLTAITMPGTNGQTIVLTYDEAMGGVVPTGDMFTILVDGVASTVSSVAVVGQQVTLTMSPPIELGQTVSVAYTPPTPNSRADAAAIQDVYGNDASSITATSVPNTSTAVVDRTAPVYQSAATNANGTQIILTYNEALSSRTASPSDYSITLNGMAFSPTAVSVSGSTVILTVGTSIVAGESVAVSYTAPTSSGLTSNSAVQDLSGNDAAALTSTSVTNNSNGQPDLTSPTVSSVTYSGTQVTLTLNEPLSATSAGTSQYTVFVGNTPVTPSAVSISGQTVVLTLPSTIPAGTVIAVSYTAPLPAVSNTSNQALQDLRGNDAASFNTSNQPTSTSWEWVGGQPTQTCPGSGSAYPNSSKSKLLPNGVTYTVSVTGDYLCIDQATESLSERGGQAGDFQSVGLVTEPGLMMWTSNNGCVATQLIGRCDNRGVMTISFSKPVTNPVVSFAGWGGGSNGAGWSEMQLLGGMNGSSSVPGARFTALAGTNIQISQNGTVVGNVDGTVPAIYCHRTSGYGANSQAVCGSLQLEGVYTSATFQVNFEYAASSTGSDGGNEDAWNLTASIPEDFGMVPTSYDNPVASHALGSLKLGSVVTADNPSSLYSTTNADAVAAGTEIKAGAKNLSNGNVIVDDGVPQVSWSGLVNNQGGQTFTIPVTLAGVSETANLCAWIDFNRDGVFTAGERSCAPSPTIGQTSANITWTIPNDIVSGPTYARVRLSYDSLALPSGKVGSGEVEDYSLSIASFAIPSAVKDDSIGAKDVNQTISPLVNDQFEPGAANDMAKMFLCLPAQTPMNCTIGVGQSLTIPDEGTYTLNANGTVTFDPVPTFTGTATPIKYQIADNQNRTSSSTLNPVVIPAPTGFPDASSGDYDKDQIINPLSNDVRGSASYPLVANSIKLCQVDDPATGGNEAQSPNSCSATSVTIPGEGTYTLNSDGTVTFNPLPTFYGTVATPVKYQAQDTLGQFENSTITPTVAQPPTATATNDVSSGNYDTNQVIRPLENDSSGSNEQTLLPETLKLCNPASTPPQTSPNCTLTSLTTADGTYTVNADGTVTFNPLPTFTGTVVTPVGYQVTDALSRKVSANITPTVGLPPAPSAAPETTTGPYNTPQSTTPLTNETPGSASFPLSQSALKLCAIDDTSTLFTNEAQSPNNCSATSVTIPGEGTYAYDATTGRITFTPLPTFTGQATPIAYQTKDSLDRFVNSTYTPTVGTPPPPTAVANASSGDYDQNQTITPLGNDTAGSSAFPIDASTIRLCQVDDPATSPANEAQSPNNCSVGVNGTVTIPGEGTYTLNSDGTVTFNPLPTFAGTVQTPLRYQVADTRGVIVNSTISPTVLDPAPPTADPETTIGKKGAAQTTDLLVGDATSDPDINLVASSVKLCDPATNEIAPNCTLTTLVVPNVGTYIVVNGVMTFTPLSTYVGTPTPVAYQVTDSMGGTATSTYTPSVIPPPTANPDTSSGNWKSNQTMNVIDNPAGSSGDDTADVGTSLDLTSVKISCSAAANCTETVVNGVVTEVTIANQGKYTVDAATGDVTFDPLDTFTGQATSVTYTVSDNLGQTATSTYTPTVNPPAPPTADAETTTGSKGVAQTTDLLVGDSTSDPSITLVASSVKLCDPTTNPAQVAPNCTLTTLTVPGVGTYTVVNGVMTFTPDANYVGTPTPVAYQVTDSLGATAGSTYTPTVVAPPTASPNTTTGAKGVPQEVSLVDNDNAATGATLDPTSVKLCDPNPTAEVAPNCTKTSVTVAGVGTYSVDSTGKLTFTPDANYVGTPPALSYTVTDSLGAKASSTYTPTVIGTPTAVADTSTGPQGVAQSRNVFTNDSAASGTNLVSSTVTLSCASAPNCTRNVNGTVTIDGQGTYSAAAADGTVVFTPLPTFTGTATPVTYTVSDALGQSATTTYTPTVIPAPVAINDTSTNGQDKNQLIDVLDNDTVPTNPAGDPLDPTTVKLCDPTTNPAQVAPNCTLTTLTTVDGTYTVNPTTGEVTFDPIPSFTGTVSTPVRYQVSDTGSTPQVTSALITPTVIPGPTAQNDTSSGPMNTAQTKTLVTNDSAASGATLDVASVKLCDPNPTAEVAPNCTKTSVTVAGVGTYAVDSSGVMTFTPVNGYSGTPAPLSYTVEDSFDVKATATYTPTVIPPPTVVPDTSTGPWDTNQTRNVIDNNVNTSDSAATGTNLVAGSLRLCAPTDTAPNCTIDASGSVVIPNQGTYTVDQTTGVVTFDPLPTFKGTASPVTYSVTDALGQKSSTTYTPTVSAPPAPMADPETTSGPKGATQTIDLLPGDTTFDPAITLDPSSVKLCGISPAEVMPNCTKSSLTVARVGTYAVSNGVMTFTPEPNYTGTPAPVSYQVTDSLGGKATSTYTPTIIPPPTVVPDTSTGPWDTNQTRNVIDNNVNTSDSAAPGTTLAAGSVRLCAPTDTAPNCTIDASGSVVIANQGTYTVDPATGIVTFDPLPTFTGTATPVTYSVTDALGQKSSTTYTPTVTVPPVPTATPDTVELIPGQSKVFSSIFDGQTGDADPALATKGTGGPDLTNATVCIIDPATTVCDTDGIVTIAGQGTYTLNPTTGIVTYAALSSATPGAKTPVTYKITDGLGRSVTSTLTPTITSPPVANPDFSTGVQGAIQTLSPVGNDRPGGGASTELFPDTRAQIPSGVFLCAANQPPPDCAASTVSVTDPVTNATLGVLTVAASGLVTFTPEPNFIGTTPPIGYQIPDNLGQKAYSTITITVVPPPAPAATIDTGSAEYNKPVTLRPWINDAAGAVPAGSTLPAPNLVATSIKLCDDNSTFVAMSGTPADCTATKVKTVEGTYEVNATTGEVIFTPNPNMVDPITGLPTGKGFTGTVNYPPTYQIWNNWTGLGGAKSATALLVPTIAPPGAPAATVDITKTKPGTSVVLSPVANDKPGTAALDPTTIRLCGAGEISPACTQMSVTTLDGLYVVEPTTGQVTFTPRDGFTGQATIPYVIKDGLGMMANANLIITVEDTAVVPVAKKTKVGLAKTGGTRPDLLLLLGLVAIAGAGGLRVLGRKK